MTGFYQKLVASWESRKSLLCIGLDPDFRKLPANLLQSKTPLLDFNKIIIDSTAEFACAYKPQVAHYAAARAESELEDTIAYIKSSYPDLPIILDAKRGDIGPTAGMYAVEAFERYQADAVTINPYIGSDTITPFADYADRGIIVLCRTSNPHSDNIQGLISDGYKIYEHVAMLAAKNWNRNKNIALVVGAAFPKDLAGVRKIVGDMPLLVPGIGVQGGDLRAVLKHGLDQRGTGLMINVSRAIMYASTGSDFDRAAFRAARHYFNQINEIRKTA